MQVMSKVFQDSELANRVQRSLNQSGYSDLRHLNVDAIEEGVVLRGVVRSYYLKQLAQSFAMQTEGVVRFVDEVIVA